MTDHNTEQRQEWLRDMQGIESEIEHERDTESDPIWRALLLIIVVLGAYALAQNDEPVAQLPIVTWNR